MKTNAIFIAVLVLFDGGAVAWAAWELWSMRSKTDASVTSPENGGAASPEPPGHPEGEHGPDQG